MKTIKEIYEYYSEIFKDLDCKVYIAGGAIRDYLLKQEPKDYDIFLMFKEFTGAGYIEYSYDVLDCLSSDKTSKNENANQEYDSVLFPVCNTKYKKHDIQIMIRPYQEIERLLYEFDWCICKFAYGEEGIIKGYDENNFLTGDFLELNNILLPISTLRRGFDFCKRFNIRMTDTDMATLMERSLAHLKENLIEDFKQSYEDYIKNKIELDELPF